MCVRARMCVYVGPWNLTHPVCIFSCFAPLAVIMRASVTQAACVCVCVCTGDCRVSPAAFAHMTHLIKAVAPVVMLLEGGYSLDATARCTHTHTHTHTHREARALELIQLDHGQSTLARAAGQG